LIELTPIPYIAAAAARGVRHRHGDPNGVGFEVVLLGPDRIARTR